MLAPPGQHVCLLRLLIKLLIIEGCHGRQQLADHNYYLQYIQNFELHISVFTFVQILFLNFIFMLTYYYGEYK